MTVPRQYNFLWRLSRPLLPLVLARRARAGKEDAARLDERYGRYTHRDDLPDSPIWIHAVSVGETVAGIALIEALRAAGDTTPVIVTTNTVTAAARVDALLPSLDVTHLYQPLDHPDMVAAFLGRLRPRLAVFMESDFWPNLVTMTTTAGIPVAFVSSQLSDRAMAQWQRQPRMARALFGAADLVLAVDGKQADRLTALGAKPGAVRIGGSLKLPAAASAPDEALVAMLRGAAGARKLLLAASTHHGEEQIVIEAASRLGKDWFTVIAPRHPQRGGEVAMLCSKAGQPARRRGTGELATPDETIYIADTLGEMDSLFAVADLVFLGGSLVPRGGHNPLEPAAHGLAILTGPHVFKNSAEFEALAAAGVVSHVDDAESLASTAATLAGNADRLAKISKAGRAHAYETGKRPAKAASLCLDLMKGEMKKGKPMTGDLMKGGTATS